jgi:hypothetical protein
VAAVTADDVGILVENGATAGNVEVTATHLSMQVLVG